MKTNYTRSLVWMILALFLAAMACNLPNQTAPATLAPPVEQPAQPTTEPPTQPPPTEPPPPVAPTETPLPTLTATLVHLLIPGDPPASKTFVTDQSTKQYAAERRAIADNFNKNLLERPFTAQEMEYQPHLDLTRIELALSEPWMYVTLLLEGEPPADSQAVYSLEIDLDQDGRGDWLISGQTPPSAEWTVAGVQVWRDSNNDVGGKAPVLAEAPVPGLDGYDELVFDQGQGNDPDAAWVRRDPNNRNRIQLAFKFTLIASPGKFLFGGWADEGVRTPGWLDYNDHFSIAEAGSPASNSSEYPLKALAAVDNSCRWTYGFQPTTSIPGLCELKPTPTPTTQPRPTVCQPPPFGCPVFGAVALVWNPDTCQCELP